MKPSDPPSIGRRSQQAAMSFPAERTYSRSSLPRRTFEQSSNPSANIHLTPPRCPPIHHRLVAGRSMLRSPFRQKGPTVGPPCRAHPYPNLLIAARYPRRATRRVSSPRQMVFQPGSPSDLRQRNPPRLARARMKSRTVFSGRGFLRT